MHLAVYGAKSLALSIYQAIRELYPKHSVCCFLVSSLQNNPSMLASLPVMELEEFSQELSQNKKCVLHVLIGTPEDMHPEITSTLSQNGFYHYACIDSRREAKLMEQYFIRRQIFSFSHTLKSGIKTAHLQDFMAKFYKDRFETDIKRLAELSCGDAYRIQLTGGEPLLNPKAIEYAIIARKYFPNARIAFISNGTLLEKQEKSFFEKCVKYRIEMDYEQLSGFLEKEGIKWKYQNGNAVKKWRKEVFDLNPNNPKSPAAHNWLNCYMANNCIQLNNGKLMCTKISNAHYFIDYFKDQCSNMYITGRDYIDIYKVQSIEEIFDFFSRPFPFCKYCKVDVMEEVEWSVSKKKIEEWI